MVARQMRSKSGTFYAVGALVLSLSAVNLVVQPRVRLSVSAFVGQIALAAVMFALGYKVRRK